MKKEKNKMLDYKELLIDVLSVQTSSGQEDLMIEYIKEFVKNNVPDADIVIKDNNIYVTKGTTYSKGAYPCVVAHTDTVHKIHKDFKVYENKDIIFAFSNDECGQVGVGGDDKVGVWIALEMLISCDTIKCAFFHSEEVGCVGSSQADMEWFSDVGYVFQSDRRGHGDFVNSIGGKELFDKKFSKKISKVIKHHGYKETSGAMTDVEQLVDNGLDVCVANMSSGYYNPHTDSEVVDFYAAENCLLMIERLIEELGCEKYTNSEFGKTSWSNQWNSYNGYGGYGGHYHWNDYGSDGMEAEVVIEGDGQEVCYYCGDSVFPSNWGKNYRWCHGCNSEVYYGKGEIDIDPNQTQIDYDDIADNYDGSMKHKQVVNTILNKHYKTKNK
jgi:tripeptide aminopeptidase